MMMVKSILVWAALLAGLVNCSAQTGFPLVLKQKITASDAVEGLTFPNSMAVSGNIAVVGASGYKNFRGAAYVLQRDIHGRWQEFQQLIPSDGADEDGFGLSVSVQGSYIFIGAPHKDQYAGTIYVFKQGGTGSWSEVQKIRPADITAPEEFGTAVVLSGRYAFIGAGAEGTNGYGAVYIYNLDSTGTWVKVQKVDAPVNGISFGEAIAADSGKLLIGAYGSYAGKGAAYLYRQDSTTQKWVLRQTLTAYDGAIYDKYGLSLSLSHGTAIIGAYGHNNDFGAAYLYEQNSKDSLVFTKKLEDTATIPGGFGVFVTMGKDYAVVGQSSGNNYRGYAFAYVRDSLGHWVLAQRLASGDTSGNGLFGSSIVAGEGFILAGAPALNGFEGAVYCFMPATADTTEALNGMRDDERSKIYMAPNPTNGICMVSFDRIVEDACVYVFDYTGREVARVAVQNAGYAGIDISHLASGLYIVQYQHGKDRLSAKLVKE
jgi:hypothetical protein